ncbi:RelA/SpoT family protein [Marinicellulosiphila megalodicopiae]|uniref:RelA/SpoT family protein n=1 Tax=Marinicellulosiphila megalodicopiae TaxID=2724896 RepID=UPI003BAEFC0B
MPSINALADRLKEYLPEEQIRQVKRAYYYAEQAHEGQNRQSGEHYVTHPLAVANILSEIKLDSQTLMAAMLHDVIEDTNIPKSAIVAQFGDEVANLVDGVSKLTHLEFETKQHEQAENFQKMIMAMTRDIRVIIVKLADRIHNMRTLGALRPDKKRRIARETLDIYSPIAARLGINNFRVELEDLCFHALHPMRAQLIQNATKNMRGRRKDNIDQVTSSISDKINLLNFEYEISGREKHLYSIYNKMKNNRKSFRDILDVFAFRIIVKTSDDCYRALGAVHSAYTPISDRFKDYIAVPKANGYQSLHTIVISPRGLPLEIQIRTKEMEAHSNHGVASHWLYKESDDTQSNSLTNLRAQKWVKSLLDMQEQASTPLEFIEDVKSDLFPEEIYVFSPKGKIIELHAGATAVDFAFAIHTKIGEQCVGCEINNRISSLSEPLKNGDTIKIKTVEGARPNPAWLSFIKTQKARSNIRSYLKQLKSSDTTLLGRNLLENALSITNHTLDSISLTVIDSVLNESNFSTLNELLEDIGLGNKLAYIVASKLIQSTEVSPNSKEVIQTPMKIHGNEGLAISYAKCCSPIPGDHILGVINVGKGVVIHRSRCSNLVDIRNQADRCLHLTWDKEMHGQFFVTLAIDASDHPGVLAEIAGTIALEHANINSINIDKSDKHMSRLKINISIENRIHMAQVMKRLRKLKSVYKIIRTKN